MKERLALVAREDIRGTWRITIPKWLARKAKNNLNISEERKDIPLMVEVEL